MNPKWIGTTFASILLAILLRVGLHVPFFTTFITLGIIFVMHVVRTEMGTGADTLWKWIKKAGNVAMGMVIFLALRFLVAKALGLYPIDTYGEIDNSGGLYGILPSHNISTVILWEVTFAMIAGQITVMWVNGTHKMPVRIAIAGSFLILTLQIAFPTYAKTWPSREVVSTNLVHHGVVGTTAIAGWRFAFGNPDPQPTPPTVSVTTAPETTITKTLIPRFDGFTRCEPRIDFEFELDTQGDPISLKFPGVDAPLEYSGKGTINAPTNRLSGPVIITSQDSQKQARVRIWEVVYLPERR